MSFRLLILFLCTAFGTFCGYLVLLSHKRSYLYLDGMCGLIAALKQNLAYKKDPVSKVLGGFSAENSHLKKNVNEYINFAEGGSDKITISRGFLSQPAFDGAVEFFGAIGDSDEKTLCSRLDAFSAKFDKMRQVAEDKYKKLGAAAVKLGFLAGLGIGILIL